MSENLIEFDQALKEILDGKRVTRKDWEDKRHYGLMKDEMLQIHKSGEAEGVTHPWILTEWDLIGDDWFVC